MHSCVTGQRLLPKAVSAKDEVLEEGVMWERIPGDMSVKVSLSSVEIITQVLGCFAMSSYAQFSHAIVLILYVKATLYLSLPV